MKYQDDFEKIIEKYKLWENKYFIHILPPKIDIESGYNARLNHCYPSPEHMPKMEYSRYLKEYDEIAYNCGFADYIDTLRENYFERNEEEFYPIQVIKNAINETLEELSATILNDQLL